MITFGQRLKELRTLKRLTQQQLADVFYLNKRIKNFEKVNSTTISRCILLK